MNRRRMMMLRQSKGYELITDGTTGVLPSTSDWTYNVITGGGHFIISNGYLQIGSGSAWQAQGLTPTQRPLGQTDNISISATIKINRNWYSGFSLVATNGEKAAQFKIAFNGAATSTTAWKFQVRNNTGSMTQIKTHSFDVVDNFAKLELVLTGDIYTCYINGEQVYTAQAIDYASLPTEYRNNMIAHNSDSNASWFISEMTYKEW